MIGKFFYYLYTLSDKFAKNLSFLVKRKHSKIPANINAPNKKIAPFYFGSIAPS